MNLTFTIQNQTIIRTDCNRPAANSHEYLYVQADFSDDWDGTEKSCIVYAPDDQNVQMEANKTGELWVIPSSLITEAGFYLTFVGISGDQTITTDRRFIEVKPSGWQPGSMPEDREPSKYEQIARELTELKEAAETAEDGAQNAADEAAKSADDASRSAEMAANIQADIQERQADITQKHGEVEADRAEVEENAGAAEQAKEGAQQAYSDFLNQLGTDVATLVGGKIPMSQIPATATQEIYQVSSEDELTGLIAQRGDLAELIETVDGEKTVTKTWQCLGDASIRDNWVVWGTSYAVQAGNAETAANAENANTINHHRVITMSQSEFETAVKDENTLYLVGDFA